MNPPNRSEGRLRSVYAATAASLDMADILDQAVGLLCLFGLIVFVGSVVGAVG